MTDQKSKIKNSSFAKAAKDGQKSNNPQKPASKAASMADLMRSIDSTFVSLKKGENLEGTITKLSSSEILVDIGAKTEAVVLEKDRKIMRGLLSSLNTGDKVRVTVLNPESEMGNAVVSLRKFADDKNWDKLSKLQKKNEFVEAIVTDTTKGGFLVTTKDQISGFLPNSQILFAEAGQNPVGKTLKVSVLELNRPMHKIIFSQKPTVSREDFDRIISSFTSEQITDSVITNIAPFGVFVSIPKGDGSIEGFIHLSEITWERLSQIPDNLKIGQKLKAMVIGFDKKGLRVNLSLKRLTEDPFAKELEKYGPDKKLSAKVLKIVSNGVLLDLGDSIEGIIKKEKIPPTVSYKVGETVKAVVLEVDKRRHQVILVPVLTEKPIGYR